MGVNPGYLPGERSDINKGKIGHKKAQGALESEMDKLKVLNRSELKHDVEYLNMSTNLKAQIDGGDKKARKLMKLK